MNIYSNGIMFFAYITLCCVCTVLILIAVLVFYVLGSEKLRKTLLTLSLIKTLVSFVTDLYKGFSTSGKSKTKTHENKLPVNKSEFVDAEFREKND